MKTPRDASGTDVSTAFDAWMFPNGHKRDTFAMADLYQIGLPFGASGTTVLAYTNAEVDLTIGGVTYQAKASQLTRDTVRTIIGVEVDELKITLRPWVPNPGSADHELMLERVPGTTVTLPHAATAGLFDGATVTLARAFFDTPPVWHTAPTLRGIVTLFVGNVATVQVTREHLAFQVRSTLERLNQNVPRNIYQPGCLNTLYDPLCGVSATASRVSANVNGPASTTLAVVLTTIPAGQAIYDLGTLAVALGPFTGLRRTIKTVRSQLVTLIQPLPFALDDAQLVWLYQGCDKTLATCEARFNNRARFRGFPFIPTPESAL